MKPILILSCFRNFALDVDLTFLSMPFMLAPAPAGFSLGLLTWLKVPVFYQTLLGFYILISVISCIPSLMQNRYLQICRNSKTWSKTLQILTYLINYTTAFVALTIYLAKIPDQISAKNNLIHEFSVDFCTQKSLQNLISERDILVISLDSTDPASKTSIHSFIISLEVVYFAISTYYYLYFKYDITLSPATRKLQKNVFIATCLQITIPTISLMFPGIYLAYSSLFGYYNQNFNNFIALIFCMHGSVQTISMIFLHRPYRSFLFEETKKIHNFENNSSFWTIEKLLN
ncbi:unnamed protein product [Caenorhabditis angaria]|uniref:Serpentine Receptor, class H n=1 Tax=Caenorhabditis angaria TaxID=860376 RepID=A0A9P1N6Y3_9PELO|nr:unnamed protein product [Caenorhabditis angaria]